MVGAVRAEGEGTTEKDTPKVHQWNYCVGNSDFSLTVDDCPAVNPRTGDWSFIPAGPDHALVAGAGEGSLLCMVRTLYQGKGFLYSSRKRGRI